MIRYALDTDIYSLLEDGHPEVTARVFAIPSADVGVTAITIDEPVAGWLSYIRRAVRPDRIEYGYLKLAETVFALAKFPVLHYTQAAIARYDTLKRLKLNVGGNDLRIAAIALEAGAVVVSRNVRDFSRVPGLIVEDWSVPPGP